MKKKTYTKLAAVSFFSVPIPIIHLTMYNTYSTSHIQVLYRKKSTFLQPPTLIHIKAKSPLDFHYSFYCHLNVQCLCSFFSLYNT